MPLETKLETAAKRLAATGKETRKHPISSVSSLCMLTCMAVVFTTFSQTTGPSNPPAETRIPIGTTTIGGGDPIEIPSSNIALTSRDGRTAIFNILGFATTGVKVSRNGKQSIILWDQLSWESMSLLTGQKLSYDKPGKDAQWLPTGQVGCCKRRR